MTTSKRNMTEVWKRKQPAVPGPNRSFGGYYRSADRELNGKVFRGVPLQTAEDAVVSAVRLGYRVVDGQIERGMRVARNLRNSAEATGSGDPKEMVDSTERLVTKAGLFILQSIESAARQPEHPLRRLISAELRMLAAWFGVADSDKSSSDPSAPTQPTASSQAAGDNSPRPRAQPRTEIRHLIKDVSQRRPVKRVVRCELYGTLPSTDRPNPLYFRPEQSGRGNANQLMEGGIELGAQSVTISVKAGLEDSPGRWSAGIYDNDKQVGFVEIEL